MKIKWRVAPVPTGKYRSFDRRGWPFAEDERGRSIAMIVCDDSYVPSRVKTGEHAELQIYVADYRPAPGSFRWRRLVKRGATLDEAKRLVSEFFEKYPHVAEPVN